MGPDLKSRFKHDVELVKAVLRRWDPIGVVPEDEYDSYAPQLLSLLYAHCPKAEMADRLEALRTVTMGLPAARRRDEEIADELLALPLAETRAI